MVLSVTVEVLRRPWAIKRSIVDGAKGYLYDINVSVRDRREFDYPRFFEGTTGFHSRLVHMCLPNPANSIRLTIPALLGSKEIIPMVERAIEIAGYTVDGGPAWRLSYRSTQALADQLPEYVLGPDNPLTFLTPDMPCTFFNA